MSSERRLARYAGPLEVSVVVCIALLSTVDLSEFRSMAQRLDWNWLPVVVACILGIIGVFGIRWWFLAGGRLGLRRALTTTAVGLAGNQILPARGGDILRIVIAARQGDMTPHRSVSAMLVEKVLDLAAVAVIGLGAGIVVIGNQGNSALRSTALATAGLVLAASIATLVLARAGWLTSLTRRLARLVRLPSKFYRHAYRPIYHLAQGAGARALFVPTFLTLLMWTTIYSGFYRAAAAWIGTPLSFVESEVLIFAAALGLAVPAAPSGIGTFHAAIVSGFVLLGRTAAEGIVLAVVLHAAFVIGSVLVGLIALSLEPQMFRRNVHKESRP